MSSKGNSWISPDGTVYPLRGGQSHSNFAHDVLRKKLIGDSESKKLTYNHDSGSIEQKGKSGEVAAAEADKELGDPENEAHCEKLQNMGWVMASRSGKATIFHSSSMSNVRHSWHSLSSVGSDSSVSVFVIGGESSQVSIGFSSGISAISADSVDERLSRSRLAFDISNRPIQ